MSSGVFGTDRVQEEWPNPSPPDIRYEEDQRSEDRYTVDSMFPLNLAPTAIFSVNYHCLMSS